MLPQLDSEVASSTSTPRLGTGSSIAGTPRNTQVVLSLLDVLGDKWTVLIVDLLAIGPARFSELGRQIDGISNKALSHALKTLQAHGLVDRRQFLTIPPKVIYSLTTKGTTLTGPLAQLLDWVQCQASAKA